MTGLDSSEAQRHHAELLDQAAGTSVTYTVGRAEDLDVPDETVDVVVAGNTWHEFDTDAVAAESHRVLVPGGALAVWHFDWLSLPGGVVRATESLIAEFNPALAVDDAFGLYPAWTAPVAAAGFAEIETFSFDVEVRYRQREWRALVQESEAVAEALPVDAAVALDDALGARLARDFPADPLVVAHRVRALVASGRAPWLTRSTRGLPMRQPPHTSHRYAPKSLPWSRRAEKAARLASSSERNRALGCPLARQCEPITGAAPEAGGAAPPVGPRGSGHQARGPPAADAGAARHAAPSWSSKPGVAAATTARGRRSAVTSSAPSRSTTGHRPRCRGAGRPGSPTAPGGAGAPPRRRRGALRPRRTSPGRPNRGRGTGPNPGGGRDARRGPRRPGASRCSPTGRGGVVAPGAAPRTAW